MPGFNIESILSELDSLPSMPNAVNVQNPEQQTNKSVQSDISCNINNSKCSHSKSPSNRMIIFDWDDTLYPTTHFVTNATPITNKDLHEWGYRTHKLLKLYIDLFGGNNIYIITNGIQGWIDYSLYSASQLFNALNPDNITKNDDRASFNYFDEIYKLIKMHNVKTISSQYSYSNFYPNEPKKWKECTFIDWAINHFDIENNKKAKGIILSIGDSYDEWYAAKDCKKFLENPSNNDDKTEQFKLQRIKLVSEPSLSHLITEWDVLIMIAENLKNLEVSYDETCIYSLSLLNEQDCSEESSDSDRDSPRDMNIDDDNDKIE